MAEDIHDSPISKQKQKQKQQDILGRFINVFCHEHHGTAGNALCEECDDLRKYAFTRLAKCPYDPKPKCKDCATHCYRPEYRVKIAKVMRFSGMHYVKRGRLDWLVKYFFSQRK